MTGACMACLFAEVVRRNVITPSDAPRVDLSEVLETVKLAFCMGAGEAEAIRQGKVEMPLTCDPAGFVLCLECAEDYRACLETRGCDVSQVKCWIAMFTPSGGDA